MRIEEGYTTLDGYTQYALYSDENIYEIAEDRSIPDITQITMKGDTNSQYITFQMPRYFDGVDLTTKQIIVRWYNDKNVEVGAIQRRVYTFCMVVRFWSNRNTGRCWV